MKVLILSCSTGGGHNSCAKYIKQELEDNRIRVDFYDFFDIVKENAKDISSKMYLMSLGKNGNLFKNIYKLGELYSKTKIKSPVYLVNKLYKTKLYDFINKNKYDLVITTHLFPSLTLTAINKSENYTHINFLFVATDYEPCPFIEESKPNYFIMQKGIENKFYKKGIKKEVLLNFGIPVSTKFIDTAKNIKKDLNILNEKVILIMLGSMGFGNVNEIINDLLKKDNIKIIIVCGSNENLFNSLNTIKNDKLIVLGFVNNINDLIYSSDIILSKPGGLSSTEIAVFRKPLVHIFPIPGIETYNSEFFYNKKMSLKADKNEDIMKNINALLDNEDMQKELINNQKKFINCNAAKNLVNFIKKNYNKQ